MGKEPKIVKTIYEEWQKVQAAFLNTVVVGENIPHGASIEIKEDALIISF